MSGFHRWSLYPTDAYCAVIAADARRAQTDYRLDIAWELQLGELEHTALALTTRYGGRVGLASIAPSWLIEGRSIFQAAGYAQAPHIAAFAPGFLRAEARLTPTLALQADYFAVDSYSVCGRFTLANMAQQPVSLRLELVGFAALEGRELKTALLRFADRDSLTTKLAGLRSVTMLQGGRADGMSGAKIGTEVIVPPGGTTSIQWSHSFSSTSAEAAARASKWLAHDLDEEVKSIARSEESALLIETGDKELDAAVAFSCQQLLQSLLRPTSYLPFASFVATRQPGRGMETGRSWTGQNPCDAYLTALGLAPLDSAAAQGIIRNYLAVQKHDGWVDFQPGLGGQRKGVICLPILARLAWGVFQYTEDDAFLEEAYPKLVKFFERWMQPDLDADGDGIPEWQAEAQTGYPFMPTFAVGMPWGQGADIRLVEAPDLLAYLLSEAASLREIAYYLRDSSGEASFARHMQTLSAALEVLWRSDHFAYRDRDTHSTLPSTAILNDGQGGEEHFIAMELDSPSRLVVNIIGGWKHVPQLTLHISGRDQNGEPVVETASADRLVWTRGRGAMTTRSVFSTVDKVTTENLIASYRLQVTTMDTSRLDASALLPLWSVAIESNRAESIMKLIESDFLCRNGITMVSRNDPSYDPSNAKGAGGVWLFWNTLLGEGLLELGRCADAADLLKRIVDMQVKVLKENKSFFQFYHADEAIGLGERGHTSGIVPLHLLLRVLGVRVISPRKVWVGGTFFWNHPVTIRQFGVEIKRAKSGTTIRFPSGQVVDLPADTPFQAIIDPGAAP